MSEEDRNAYADADDYARRENDAGVAFYATLAQETGGPVLELGCGTGRACIPIAQLGYAVTGLDITPGMLEVARRRSREMGLDLRWVEGDARDFDLGGRFRLIFLTGNTFQQFLTNQDQAALLRCVHRHLEDDGVLAFETRNPLIASPGNRAALEASIEAARLRGDASLLLETREEERLWDAFTDAEGRKVRETLTQVYDPLTQIMRLKNFRRWYEDGEERLLVSNETLRFTFPQELHALLHYNGFAVERQYGGWDRSPLTALSHDNIVICRKNKA